MLAHRLRSVPKSYVILTSGINPLLTSASNITLSSELFPNVILPSNVILPVAVSLPLIYN